MKKSVPRPLTYQPYTHHPPPARLGGTGHGSRVIGCPVVLSTQTTSSSSLEVTRNPAAPDPHTDCAQPLSVEDEHGHPGNPGTMSNVGEVTRRSAGSGQIRPGALCRAHRGVLFLD